MVVEYPPTDLDPEDEDVSVRGRKTSLLSGVPELAVDEGELALITVVCPPKTSSSSTSVDPPRDTASEAPGNEVAGY